MGYYVTLIDADFSIPAGNLDAAYASMVALNERDDLKSGGRWVNGKYAEKWFSWIPTDYPEQYNNAGEIFEALGFGIDYNDDGDLFLTSYDSRSADEDDFLRAVAPLVRQGSSLTWRGEDGEVWMEVFSDGQIKTYDAQITFVARKPYDPIVS